MGWLSAALGILKSLLAAIPIFDRWFTKTPSEKIEDKKEEIREDVDDFKNTGRPKW